MRVSSLDEVRPTRLWFFILYLCIDHCTSNHSLCVVYKDTRSMTATVLTVWTSVSFSSACALVASMPELATLLPSFDGYPCFRVSLDIIKISTHHLVLLLRRNIAHSNLCVEVEERNDFWLSVRVDPLCHNVYECDYWHATLEPHVNNVCLDYPFSKDSKGWVSSCPFHWLEGSEFKCQRCKCISYHHFLFACQNIKGFAVRLELKSRSYIYFKGAYWAYYCTKLLILVSTPLDLVYFSNLICYDNHSSRLHGMSCAEFRAFPTLLFF